MPRLPQIQDKKSLPEQHQGVIDYLVQTRGAVSHGFSVLLNSPDLAGRIAHTGSYVRFESTLPDRLRELAALTASAEMGNLYERTIHAGDVAKLGVPQSTIDAIVHLQALAPDVPAEDSLPVRAARELLRVHELSQATFEEARTQLGDQGVVDLVGNIGYYTMLACLHVALGVTPPAPTQA
jgi:4-carboxymuconolactone decarboxylase